MHPQGPLGRTAPMEQSDLDSCLSDEVMGSQSLRFAGEDCRGMAQSSLQPNAAVSNTSGNAPLVNQGSAQIAESRQPLVKRQREYPNWREISDPEERRKQRRLAKNRATAARSRERKRIEVEGLQQQNAALSTYINQLQNENRLLQQHCSGLEDQIASLKGELLQIRNLVASHARGATTAVQRAGPAESKPKLATLQLVVAAHLQLWRYRIFKTLFWMLTFWAMVLTQSTNCLRFDKLILRNRSSSVQQPSYADSERKRIALLTRNTVRLSRLQQKEPS